MAGSSGSGSPLEEAFRRFTVAPWTNWANAFSPVFNPQLIISENRDDAAVENHVLSQVGSYGKQLGVIIDALGVLIARTLDRSQLTPGEHRIVDDLQELARQVEQAVADYRGTPRKGIGRADIDSVIEGLQSLQHSDPAAYGPLFEHLRQFVDGQAGGPAPHPEPTTSIRVPRS
ncbi:MAG: hypothetical protein E6G66_09590 [Actinobacteria bacterium]|nr:MAG: hypothetical protein E6G66_09590 [Actinomycetota bacterium]